MSYPGRPWPDLLQLLDKSLSSFGKVASESQQFWPAFFPVLTASPVSSLRLCLVASQRAKLTALALPMKMVRTFVRLGWAKHDSATLSCLHCLVWFTVGMQFVKKILETLPSRTEHLLLRFQGGESNKEAFQMSKHFATFH